jgi:hypothetical protein
MLMGKNTLQNQNKTIRMAQIAQPLRRCVFFSSNSEAIGNTVASGRETSATGKHRTGATEGGFGLVPRVILSLTPWLPGEKQAQWGKHRTEATEVTEGDLGWCPE